VLTDTAWRWAVDSVLCESPLTLRVKVNRALLQSHWYRQGVL